LDRPTYAAVADESIAESNPSDATTGRGNNSVSAADVLAALIAACMHKMAIRKRSRGVCT
jgi:hypothetical protein